jgi:predicted cupin superfamily sugar epimerase
MNAQYFIEKLNLEPHIEGGYFKESFVSEQNINDGKKLWTSIYFLLQTGDVSNLHVLKSDEMWYYHAGSSLTIYMISPNGELTTKNLGLNFEKGETPQFLVPKGYIFGSAMNEDGFSLVGCMVSPGFTFEDFKLLKRAELLNLYPEHEVIIKKLTREK